MIDLKTTIADTVADVVRHLAAFATTTELSQVCKARNAINRLARHEVCGISETVSGMQAQDSRCEYGCAEIAVALWNVTLFLQREQARGGDE